MVLYQYLHPTTTPAVEVTGTSTKTPAPDTRENLYPEKFRIKEDSSNPRNIEPSKFCTRTVGNRFSPKVGRRSSLRTYYCTHLVPLTP